MPEWGIYGASRLDVAELAPQLVFLGGDEALHPRQALLEAAEAVPERAHGLVRLRAHAAPEFRLRGAAIERRGLGLEYQRQHGIGDHRGQEEEEERRQHRQAQIGRRDAEVIGDPRADAGEDAVLRVAIEAMEIIKAREHAASSHGLARQPGASASRTRSRLSIRAASRS